jgi:hypothetical protein
MPTGRSQREFEQKAAKETKALGVHRLKPAVHGIGRVQSKVSIPLCFLCYLLFRFALLLLFNFRLRGSDFFANGVSRKTSDHDVLTKFGDL